MKCLLCENLSFSIICKSCQKNLLEASFYKRELKKGFYNYSFYSLSQIEDLINSKYYFYGDRIYNLLAKLSYKKFSSNFTFNEPIISIGIDEHTRHDFSQTAILSRHLKSKFITPVYGKLLASNKIKYAGKDLEFRQKNKRKFITNLTNKNIILVDDVITTGTTILEAKKCLERKNNKVLFSLTLADAKF